jgi:hypothetical protein
MEDFGFKEHFGRYHRIFFWQVEFSFEHSTFIGSALWTGDLHEKVSGIVLVWLCVYSNN